MHRYSLPVSATRDKLSPIHNLMNYSMPPLDSTPPSLPVPNQPRRPIQHGDVDTRLRQLEGEIERLTLSNARLLRVNRLFKVETDRVLEEQTAELKEDMKRLTHQNVLLQRSNRLLQDDLQRKTEELNMVREDQVQNVKNVGPEYEYLVQMINSLFRQLTNSPSCDPTCCYTEQPTDQDNYPHICRPVIRSHASRGGLVSVLQKENADLRDDIKSLNDDCEDLTQQLKDKDEDKDKLKHELQIKEEIVSQLEKEFERMEQEVGELQKVIK